MTKLCANLTMLYNECDFLDRFGAAAEDGFKGVEYLFPYAFQAQDISARLKDHGLIQVLHNLPAGNWDQGERGIAVLPDRVAEFRDGVEQAIEYASVLGCKRINCLAGITPDGVEPEKVRDVFLENISFAASKLKSAGIALLIEAINTRDIPGFFLNRTRQTADLIAATGHDNIFVQYDIYHMQIMEGDIAPTIQQYLPAIKHIQLADNPGRHEPGTGEINYPFLFDYIDGLGYSGWIGCEYKPATTTKEGLDWAKKYL